MTDCLVLFDMDDVLCRYEVEARIAALASRAGCTPDHVRREIWESGFIEAGDRGEYSADAYLREFGKRLGAELSRDQWLSARRLAMPPNADVLDLVRRVRAEARVGILTNNDLIVAGAIPELFPALPELFGPAILVSAMLGRSKPDPACFLAACERLGAAPSSTFFTDDKAENVEGAQAAGLAGHVFQGAQGLEQALREWGLRLG
jgi:HAD superfamily hydrolase (TIGR01509 family)